MMSGLAWPGKGKGYLIESRQANFTRNAIARNVPVPSPEGLETSQDYPGQRERDAKGKATTFLAGLPTRPAYLLPAFNYISLSIYNIYSHIWFYAWVYKSNACPSPGSHSKLIKRTHEKKKNIISS